VLPRQFAVPSALRILRWPARKVRAFGVDWVTLPRPSFFLPNGNRGAKKTTRHYIFKEIEAVADDEFCRRRIMARLWLKRLKPLKRTAKISENWPI
jgi:hypothetical protein